MTFFVVFLRIQVDVCLKPDPDNVGNPDQTQSQPRQGHRPVPLSQPRANWRRNTMLYLVKRPDDANHPTPTFVRHGRATTDLPKALRQAFRLKGRVYGYDGENHLVHDFWVPPEVTPISPGSRNYRQQRAMAELFGVLA